MAVDGNTDEENASLNSPWDEVEMSKVEAMVVAAEAAWRSCADTMGSAESNATTESLVNDKDGSEAGSPHSPTDNKGSFIMVQDTPLP